MSVLDMYCCLSVCVCLSQPCGLYHSLLLEGMHLSFQTHADYSIDKYLAHRVAQTYELGQFIKHTSQACDAVVVGGDFNFKPEDLGYKLAMTNGNLLDSWTTQVNYQ